MKHTPKIEQVEMVFLGCSLEEELHITFIDCRDYDLVEHTFDKETCRTYTLDPNHKLGFEQICVLQGISKEKCDELEAERDWIVQKKAKVVFQFISDLYRAPKYTTYTAAVEDEYWITEVFR